jgi:DNA-binding NtrC family response regulator
MCQIINDALKKFLKIDADYTTNPKEGLQAVEHNEYQLIILDYMMPEMNGFQFLDKLNKNKALNNIKIIMITGHGDFQTGIQAIEKGCFDYFEKPFNIKNLVFKIQKTIEFLELTKEVKMLSKPISVDVEQIIGESEEIQKMNKIITRIADKDTTILIEGETGTGKELVAKDIYKLSGRADKIFIPLNCGALTETLLESELFGHEKGSFTGAIKKKYGIFETANEGTVFLDEINSASLNVQLKLLRFIETGEFFRVGGNKVIHCNTRIITASNQNIEKLIKEKTFREDLYHRLNIIKIIVPPLRNRINDIPLLINFFIERYNKKHGKNIKFDNETVVVMQNYSWPGNVRQLQNQIQSLILLNDTPVIKPEQLPQMIKAEEKFPRDDFSYKSQKQALINEFELKFFDKLLKKSAGNVSKAAKISEIHRLTLIDKLQQYDIKPAQYKKYK